MEDDESQPVPHQLDLSRALDLAYANAMVALHYADLLGRHANDALAVLSDEPGTPSFRLAFQTDNSDVPRLAKEQFADEVRRYALVYALAQFDRFVVDLAVLDALASVAAQHDGQVAVVRASEIEASIRNVKWNQSVVEELTRLAGAGNETLRDGITWFRGLYAIRNCLMHRAGVVGSPDKKLVQGITWRHIVLTHKGEELSGSFPQALGERTISVAVRDASRSWQVGDRVTLSLDELHQMMFALFQLAAGLVQHLNGDFRRRLETVTHDGDLNL